MVEQSAGVIEVASDVGSGTTFRVWFPLHRGPAASVEPRPSSPVHHGGSERILLVEDDRRLREATAELLRNLGYEVIVAEDA